MILTKTMGKNKYTYPMFDNNLLVSSKQLRLCPREFIFPIKQEDIFNFMYSVLMLDVIIMNLFSDITKKQIQ